MAQRVVLLNCWCLATRSAAWSLLTVGVLVLHNPCTAPPCPSPNRQCRGGHPYSPDSRTTPNQRHSAGGMMRLRSRFRICLPSPCCCALQADTWQHGKTSSRLLPRAGAPPHNITHMSRTVQLQGLTAPSPAPVTARPVACQRQPLHKADIPHSLCPRLRHFQRYYKILWSSRHGPVCAPLFTGAGRPVFLQSALEQTACANRQQ